jgi:hypothetical protein
MAKRNITVQVDEKVIEQARVIAARRGMSISALLAQQLCTIAANDARYEQARACAGSDGRGSGPRWRDLAT